MTDGYITVPYGCVTMYTGDEWDSEVRWWVLKNIEASSPSYSRQIDQVFLFETPCIWTENIGSGDNNFQMEIVVSQHGIRSLSLGTASSATQ